MPVEGYLAFLTSRRRWGSHCYNMVKCCLVESGSTTAFFFKPSNEWVMGIRGKCTRDCIMSSSALGMMGPRPTTINSFIQNLVHCCQSGHKYDQHLHLGAYVLTGFEQTCFLHTLMPCQLNVGGKANFKTAGGM